MKTPHAQKSTFQAQEYSAPATGPVTYQVNKIPFKFLSEYRPLTPLEAKAVQALIMLSEGKKKQKK